MRTKIAFYILFVPCTFLLTACNESKDEENTISKKPIVAKKIAKDFNQTEQKVKLLKEKISTLIFNFKNLQNQTLTLHVKNDYYHFLHIEQPIVMINLSSTWCPPCRGEVPHLSHLQRKFKKDLFILTALVHDSIKEEDLKKLIISEKAHFFVSSNQKENLKFETMIINKLGVVETFKLPLMILFFKGKYFTHYEGSMPEEMIESDIKQLLEKTKREK